MATTDEHFSKVLILSYDHLPNHLKACFLCMGGFPEDYEIPIFKLIMLWVAEGFLKPIWCKSLEEVAEEYLEDLVKRNLVFISKKMSNGKFRACGMHDLLRDLCIRKAQEEKFLHVYTSGIDVADQHRLTIHSQIYTNHLIENTFASPIHSVLHFGNDPHILSFVLRIILLRVLDIPETVLDSFPVEITELFHLRYFAFAYYNFWRKPVMLPPAISKLHNLQTLIIHAFPDVASARTFMIWKIPQLRHLILEGSSFRIPSPPRIGGQFPVLETLQTISGVVNFKFTRKALDMIPNLKKLEVSCTYTNCPKRRLDNLVYLHQLETLNLHFFYEPFRGRKRRLLYLPASCYALPQNLKKLTLIGARPPSNNMAIIGSLPNPEVLRLKLFYFIERYWESNEGEFPRLKFLLIEYSDLVCWRAESTHFPCLENLTIRCCRELEEIPCAIGDITTLELIEVDQYSKSAADSAVLILEEQRSLGNDILQVRIHPL